MSDVEPGWYPDANGVVRWFDGAQWTEHVQQASLPTGPPSHAPVPPPLPPPRQGPSGLLIAGLALLVVLLLSGIVVAAVVVGGGDEEAGPDGGSTTATSGETSPETSTTSDPPTPTTTAPTPTAPVPTTPTTPATPTPPPGPTADQVADRYIQATIDVDCPALRQLSTPTFFAMQTGCDGDRSTITPGDFGYTLKPAVVTGVTATVKGTLTPRDTPAASPLQFTVSLVNTARGWRVSAPGERP